nr:MAG TPA: hypothetical protein [Caudoviricetes sp.]
MQFCHFLTINQQIFRTQLHLLSVNMLLKLLRKCDMLCLPDEVNNISASYK